MFDDTFYEACNFSGTSIPDSQLDRIEFVECNFSNADFTDVAILYNCKFDNCNLSSALLNGVSFKQCAFLNCKFHHANLFATTFEDCKMTGSSFLYTDASVLGIAGGDWSYTVLSEWELDKKDLRGISFISADLTGCRFTKCRMEDCIFSDADVNNTSFQQSDIRGCDLTNVDILSINLKDTVVDLQQCILIAEALGARYKP